MSEQTQYDGVRCELCGVVRTNAIYSHHGVVRCQDWLVCEQVVALVAGARSSYADLIKAGWKPATPDADDASEWTVECADCGAVTPEHAAAHDEHHAGDVWVWALEEIEELTAAVERILAARESAAATRARAEGAAAERKRIAEACKDEAARADYGIAEAAFLAAARIARSES